MTQDSGGSDGGAPRRRSRWRLGSLRVRLAVLALVAAVPGVLVMSYAVTRQREVLTDAARHDALQLADLAARDHAEALAGARGLLVGLAHLQVMHQPGNPVCHRFLAQLLRHDPVYLNLGVIVDGKVVCSGLPLHRGPVDVSDRSYLKRALASHAFAVGDYQVGRISGKPGVVAAVPLDPSPRRGTAVVFAALGLAPLSNLAARTGMPPGTAVTLVDDRGVVIARRPEPERWVGNDVSKVPVVARALIERSGYVDGRRLDGSRGIVAFTPVDEAIGGAAPALALVGVPLAEVYGPADTTFRIGLALMVFAALLLVLGGWLVAEGMLVRPVASLLQVTRRLAEGDLSARTRSRRLPGELGELAESVDRMAEGLSSLTRENSLLLASAEEGIVGLDPEGRVTLANPAAAEILGRPLEALVGAVFHEVVHEGTVGDGHHRPDACPLLRPLHEGRPVRIGDGRFHRADGTPVPVAWTASPIRDGAEITGVAVFFSDESGRRALEGQLHQAQKLEAVGQLAGGVAHDFNNLLTAILTCATLVKHRLPDGDESQDDLDAILRSTDRASGLTRQLLAFSRRDVVSPRVLVVHEVISGLERMLARVLPENITLETTVDASSGRVRMDETHLEQIVLNLAVNARDAMPGGGTLRISVDGFEGAPGGHLEAPEGRYVRVTVADEGTGIGAETIERIFDPFFTTKPVGKGTGLGLSTVLGIVQQVHGDVVVDTREGVGTSFQVFLPVTGAAGAAPGAPDESARAGVGTESVLLVEDDVSVRPAVQRGLEAYGYRVIAAADGETALAILRSPPEPLHVLVTDLVLPGLGGDELATLAVEAIPEIRVIFVSGYAASEASRQVVLAGAPFLHKPFTVEALARRIREVLDDAAAA